MFKKSNFIVIAMFAIIVILAGCSKNNKTEEDIAVVPESNEAVDEIEIVEEKKRLLNKEKDTLEERYLCPDGYTRVEAEVGSFGDYLRKLKLKTYGEKALYYDGREKRAEGIYDSVFDYDIGNRDLHQCADAIMFLRADYLRSVGREDEIRFNFADGFKAEYIKWKEGNRITIKNNKGTWYYTGNKDQSYESFREYITMVFAYANTESLEKELILQDEDISIGDVWIKGDLPGHAIIVVDVAENVATKDRIYMLAQSYMPAQETQILINGGESEISPWYRWEKGADISTPQWSFKGNQLRKFQ